MGRLCHRSEENEMNGENEAFSEIQKGVQKRKRNYNMPDGSFVNSIKHNN